MKVFDLHIGLSDAITQLNKDPEVLGIPNEDFPNQFDFIRAKNGGLDIFCGMICPVRLNGHDITLPGDQMAEIQKHIKAYETFQQSLKIIKDSKDLNTDGLKVILGLEGTYFLKDEDDLSKVDELINNNIKIFGVKWNFESSLFDNKNKLTNLGKEFLNLCQLRNVVIDVAHSESDIIEEIFSNFSGPVIDSHTCCYLVKNTKRNIKDEFIKEIINRNGLVGITFVGEFIGGNSLNKLMEHFTYFIEKFGLDNLAIGSDFDGMDRSDLIKDLEDVSKYRNLSNRLTTIGLSDLEIEKILHINAFNYFEKQLKL